MKTIHTVFAAVLLVLGCAAYAEVAPVAPSSVSAPAQELAASSLDAPAAANVPGNIGQQHQLTAAGGPPIGISKNDQAKVMAVSVDPTPLPGALWLFGSALAGFLGFSSRRKV